MFHGGEEKGCILKEGNIGRNIIPFGQGRITLISFLKRRIFQKNTLSSLCRKLVKTGRDIMNKTSTPEHTRRDMI